MVCTFYKLGALSSSLSEGCRTIRMDETFFTGYRKTMLKPQEILVSVEIPYSRQVRRQIGANTVSKAR